MGMFIDGHDEDRFLCFQRDVPMYKNALAFIYFVEGIPIVYYGAEQSIGGTRDPMWHTGFSEETELFVYIKMLNW
jgi:alpha-amylase